MIRTFKNQQKLKCPHIIKCYDLFIERKKKCIYLIMEYCSFPSLADIIRYRRLLAECEALQIVKSLCEAVSYIHGQGICHRDLKPENILVNPLRLCEIKILDFQISY